jgi:hypothetical protein
LILRHRLDKRTRKNGVPSAEFTVPAKRRAMMEKRQRKVTNIGPDPTPAESVNPGLRSIDRLGSHRRSPAAEILVVASQPPSDPMARTAHGSHREY